MGDTKGFPKSTRTEATDLYRNAWTVRDICDKTNIGRATLYRWLDEDGIKRNRRDTVTLDTLERMAFKKRQELRDLQDRIVALTEGNDG